MPNSRPKMKFAVLYIVYVFCSLFVDYGSALLSVFMKKQGTMVPIVPYPIR